jgi:hypothetical protein
MNLRAGAKPPEDTVQHPPVIDPGNATRLVRQKRLDHRPLKSVKSKYAIAKLPFRELESVFARFVNPFMNM